MLVLLVPDSVCCGDGVSAGVAALYQPGPLRCVIEMFDRALCAFELGHR